MPTLSSMFRVGRISLMLSVLIWSAPIHARTQPHSITTVFVIALENHSWSDIAGNPSAAFINKTLLPRAARAVAYYTPPGLHPSLPNYLWLEAGSNLGVRADVSPAGARLSTTAHLVTLLSRAHISWRAYEQGISGRDCPLVDRYPYATRHNPMVYFEDVTHGLDPRSAYCIAHERPASTLLGDLKRNSVARYNFITPDVCHDMHDSCGPTGDEVRQGDAWLSQVVPQIMSSRTYRSGGAIFILWDEGSRDSDGPLGLLVLSPAARSGATSHVRYTHSSTLRTIEEIFGLKSMLGAARTSNDLRDLFARFP
jgi:hypothetical protein